MPFSDLLQFWQAITVIEAQEALRGYNISQYPHVTKESRSKMHREMHKLAYPSYSDEGNNDKAVSTREYARIMGGMKINGR